MSSGEVCGFFGPNQVRRTGAQMRDAIVARTNQEWQAWKTPAGSSRVEGDPGMFGRLVCYYLAGDSGIRPDTLVALQTTARGAISYTAFLADPQPESRIAAEAARLRERLLAGAPGAAAPGPPGLGGRVETALTRARQAHLDRGDFRAWSGAFIVACVRGAGITEGIEAVLAGRHAGRDGLLRGTFRHVTYTIEARTRRDATTPPRRGTYHAFEPRAHAPQRGDIIVQDRRTNLAVDDVATLQNPPADLATHGDIVVDVQPDFVIATGGNLSGSARRRRYPLCGSGRLVVDARQQYTQENAAGVLPNLPSVSNQPLASRSTARIFALLSLVEDCVATTTASVSAAKPAPAAAARPVPAAVAEQAPAATAACPLPKGSAVAYFFKAGHYLRYDITKDDVTVAPVAISRHWSLPKSFHSQLDAAVNWGNGYAYFFKDEHYVRYNIAKDRLDVAPTKIASGWPRLPDFFRSNIDAAVNWGNGFAYFFKQDRCARYDIARDLVDTEATITKNWPALPTGFQSSLDAVANWGNGFAYFFKGPDYVRYDIARNIVDINAKIAINWPKLPPAADPAPSFQSGLKATINWTTPCDVAKLAAASGATVTETADWRTRASTGQSGCFTPVGVMIHHTVSLGQPALNDIRTNIKANFYIDKAGTVHVITGGRANHAGFGAQTVLDETSRGIAPSGTAATRRLPDGPVGNGHFYGLENENKGDGKDPWPAAQLAAMARVSAALCQRHGWSENRVISHSEWTSRKIDPAGVDMNAFRQSVRSLF